MSEEKSEKKWSLVRGHEMKEYFTKNEYVAFLHKLIVYIFENKKLSPKKLAEETGLSIETVKKICDHKAWLAYQDNNEIALYFEALGCMESMILYYEKKKFYRYDKTMYIKYNQF